MIFKNNFTFIIQFQHKGYLNDWLCFICFLFTTGHCHVRNLKEKLLLSTLIFGSVFSNYVVFYGDTPSAIKTCHFIFHDNSGRIFALYHLYLPMKAGLIKLRHYVPPDTKMGHFGGSILMIFGLHNPLPRPLHLLPFLPIPSL